MAHVTVRLDRALFGFLLFGALGCAGANAAQARPALVFRNVRAMVEIIPEERSDYVVTVDMSGAQGKAPTVTTRGDTVTVESDWNTEVPPGRVSLNLNRGRDLSRFKAAAHRPQVVPEGLPNIEVHAPVNVSIRSNGQIFGHIGPSRTLAIHDQGRGEWRIDQTEGRLEIHGSGMTNFRAAGASDAWFDMEGTGNVACGDVPTLMADIYGAGDIAVEHVRTKAEINISGIGDFHARSISGTLRVDMDDIGNVDVLGGEVRTLKVRSIDGLGAVAFGGSVQDADLNIGDHTAVRLHKVTGTLNQTTRQLATVAIDIDQRSAPQP